MNDLNSNWSDWNPISHHYHEKESNTYESIIEDSVDVNKEENVKSPKKRHPFLIIKKKNKFITDNLLRNFFGSSNIHKIVYRSVSWTYLIYFNNIRCLEAAWSKIRQFPNIVHYEDSRSNYQIKYKENEKNLPKLPDLEPAPISLNLKARTVQVSKKNNKHPEFCKSSIVSNADYIGQNSLLAVNDVNRRYLNVRLEFTLERHGVYNLQQISQKDQAVFHYQSGRLTVTPLKLFKSKETYDEAKLAHLAKKCLACSCYTDNSCRFCQMAFCNPVCFDTLATMHHETCAKGKPPVIDNTIVSKFNKQMLPPSGTNVKITAFEQTNVVYVRSAEIVADVAYHKVLSDVMTRSKSSPQLNQLPKCGQIVIYKTNIQALRAMVLKVDNPKTIYVVCVDYGSVEITELNNLFECSDYLASLPRYAVPVLLRGVPKRYMSSNLREMFYELDHTFTFVLRYVESQFDLANGMQRVVLIESDMNRSLNRLVNAIITPVEPHLSDEGLKEDHLQHVQLPTGKGIDLIIMDNTFIKFGILHCTILDFAYEITEMQLDMQVYGESIAKCESFAPQKNELCIAKYQDKWCRGMCIELVGDGYPSILFIDYGNISPIYVDYIRPYPAQFAFQILTTEYDLLDIPDEMNDDQLNRLENYFAIGATVKFDEVIFNKDHNNYSLRLDAIKKLLE